jgi:hypothetical protein
MLLASVRQVLHVVRDLLANLFDRINSGLPFILMQERRKPVAYGLIAGAANQLLRERFTLEIEIVEKRFGNQTVEQPLNLALILAEFITRARMNGFLQDYLAAERRAGALGFDATTNRSRLARDFDGRLNPRFERRGLRSLFERGFVYQSIHRRRHLTPEISVEQEFKASNNRCFSAAIGRENEQESRLVILRGWEDDAILPFEDQEIFENEFSEKHIGAYLAQRLLNIFAHFSDKLRLRPRRAQLMPGMEVHHLDKKILEFRIMRLKKLFKRRRLFG